MMKHYAFYYNRTTELDFLNKTYYLHCENGVFFLYNPDGTPAAKSCRFPSKEAKNNPVTATSVRPENKFGLRRQATGILALIEITTGIVHDYLAETANVSNLSLFILVCKALSYYKYGPNDEIKMIPDQKTHTLSIDNGYCEIQIENNVVIYNNGVDSHYRRHIQKILNDLHIDQYQRLPKEMEENK